MVQSRLREDEFCFLPLRPLMISLMMNIEVMIRRVRVE